MMFKYRSDTGRYAWFRAPVGGMPEDNCPVPHRNISAVPGMGQWMLVDLGRDVTQAELPKGMLLANKVGDMLDDAMTQKAAA